jgi:hypothetical protein
MRQRVAAGAALLAALATLATGAGCVGSRPAAPPTATGTSPPAASASASAGASGVGSGSTSPALSVTRVLTAAQPSARVPVPAGLNARVVRLYLVDVTNPHAQELLVMVSVQDARTPSHEIDSAIFSPYPPDAPTGFVFGLSASAAQALNRSGGAFVVTVSAVPSGTALRPELRLVINIQAALE